MKIEKFDFVHDVQRIYRKLLDCTAKAGGINNIKNEIDRLEVHSTLSKELMAIAYTLLNIESRFYIEDKKESEYVRLHTFASEEKIELSEFVFLDSNILNEEKVIKILEKMSIGTLEDPHEGATLILKVPKISEEGLLELRGPGIKHNKVLEVEGLGREFFEKRAEINSEFPLGVDILFLDEFGNMCSLPRTTKVEVKK
ncbi:MAG: phosphonate C-P lyase system protein PhnH [Cetobacterium sp.]